MTDIGPVRRERIIEPTVLPVPSPPPEEWTAPPAEEPAPPVRDPDLVPA